MGTIEAQSVLAVKLKLNQLTLGFPNSLSQSACGLHTFLLSSQVFTLCHLGYIDWTHDVFL